MEQELNPHFSFNPRDKHKIMTSEVNALHYNAARNDR